MAKTRRFAPFFAVFFAALLALPAFASDASKPPPSAADEWAAMTSSERESRVSTGIGLIEKRGALLMKNTYYYVDKMGAYLRSEESRIDKNVDTAILHLIYDTEPQSRPAITDIFDEYASRHS